MYLGFVAFIDSLYRIASNLSTALILIPFRVASNDLGSI